MATTVEARRSGAQSISFYVENESGDGDIFIGQTFWVTVDSARIKALMTTVYADIESFLRAFADEGGSINSFGAYDYDPGIAGFDLDGDDKPVLTVQKTGGYVKPTVIRFALAYSASE